MGGPVIEHFRVAPAAVEWLSPSEGAWVWVTERIQFDDLGVDGLAFGFTDDYDGREWRIAEVYRDEPDRAEWLTTRGSTCVARALRPYDAVALRLSPQPLPPEVTLALRSGERSDAAEDFAGATLLDLDPGVVWHEEGEQRERTRMIAAMVEHDLVGSRTIEGWRRFVRVGNMGWAPMTVPVRAADVSYRNARFVSPTVAELLWHGVRTGFRREHVVSRSLIAAEWEAAQTQHELESIIWNHRFAVVLTTEEEAKRVDRLGSRVGRSERYLKAGIPTVYDRLFRRDVYVEALDPKSHLHQQLDDPSWDGRFEPSGRE